MSDIVERLYAWPAVEKHSDGFSSQHIGALMEEAAREIERLREALTLDELLKESLVEKHRRLVQAKCEHEEICTSTVASANGVFTNSFCLDCGKSWRGGSVDVGCRSTGDQQS